MPAGTQASVTGFALAGLGEDAPARAPEFERLWRGFMTARITLGLMLTLFEATLLHLGPAGNRLLLAVAVGYTAVALAARLLLAPRPLGPNFGLIWLACAGADIAAFGALQFMQGPVLSFVPLFALPVLLAAVLGPLSLALGTAASVTLLLLADAAWLARQLQTDATLQYIQAALAGTGTFAVAALAHQLAERLAREERQARHHALSARLQQQVNTVVIESTSDGILVVDQAGMVHAANPAAQRMLQAQARLPCVPPFDLRHEPAWRALAELVRQSLDEGRARQADVTITFAGQGPRQLRARTRLTGVPSARATAWCVLLLEDLRELEARWRTDKLASMGRMSVAVAHEIRNPLAAIVQANALLEEELGQTRQRQLTALVRQNARRLEKIVEEILDISRVPRAAPDQPGPVVELDIAVGQICQDWAAQSDCGARLQVAAAGRCRVAFEPEHLRRVLVNLLDNARRHASAAAGAIEVATRGTSAGAELSVWSDGAPIEPSVQRHLFEPFFSSESRSSGLGLYLCRELCDSHGAQIGYRRAARARAGAPVDGNEFFVSLRLDPRQP